MRRETHEAPGVLLQQYSIITRPFVNTHNESTDKHNFYLHTLHIANVRYKNCEAQRQHRMATGDYTQAENLAHLLKPIHKFTSAHLCWLNIQNV